MRNDLAVLAGGPQGPMWYLGVNAEPTVPGQGENGYADFEKLKNDALAAAISEPDQLKKQVLTGAAQLAAAAIPIPVAGWIVAGVTALATLFGITIRGRTQHVSGPEADVSARGWTESQWMLYQQLPADAKQFMIQKLYELNLEMWRVFGSWWGRAAYVREPGGPATFAQIQALPAETVVRGISGFWFHLIMTQADAESFAENMQTWYFNNYQSFVLRPLNDYMVEKYHQTLQQYVDSGGTQISPSSAGLVGILAVAAVGGALLMAKKKGRR